MVSFCWAPMTPKEGQFQLVRGSVSISAEYAKGVRGSVYVCRRGHRRKSGFYQSDGHFLLAPRTPKRGQFLLVRWSVSISAKDAEGFRWSVSVGRRGHRRRVSSY